MTPRPLPTSDDPHLLRAALARVQAERDDFYLQLLRAQQELLRLRKQVYGPRADRVKTAEEMAQLLLEFARGQEARPVNPLDLEAAGAASAEAGGEARRIVQRGGRRRLADCEDLPTTRVVHALAEAARACAACGRERSEVGADVTWQIEHIPARLERLEHVQVKYACAHCEAAGESAQMERAPKPETAIPKGLAGPGLLAYIVTSKFHDYLPLYRLERIFQRHGFEIPRGTQSVWCGDVADLLEPLYARMAAAVKASRWIATDDTIMPMQHPGQTKRARLWVYLGDGEHPYNIFDFTLTRARDGPANFLGEYGGTLLADAYGGYDGVVVSNQIRRAGCHAHARRKFVDAEASAPAIAVEAAAHYRALYAIERRGRDLDPAARLELRRRESAPRLQALHTRLLDWKAELLPKHPMAEAVGYALRQWPALSRFATDGALPIDNNASEREMKRVVLNRKNSLFVGNPRGGRTAAILSSFTSTCFRHRIDPQRYFTQLLINLPGTSIQQLDAWLPDRWLARQPGVIPTAI